jgi:uncharacterized protein (DUF1800 family)
MALDPKLNGVVALHRFGLAPRAGTLERLSSDPREMLIADLEKAPARIGDSKLLSAGEASRAAAAFRQSQRLASAADDDKVGSKTSRETSKSDGTMASDQPADMAQGGMQDPAEKSGAKPRQRGGALHQIYLDEARARFDFALSTQIGFAERLVWFWSNHFCVSASKTIVLPLAGAFEREAIRPHIRGKFADMLLAVETHPAMLLYLDNARSTGPNSVAGKLRGRGLNENLAREILELHTLGVRTGYSQTDVTNFAKVITGWSVVPRRQDDGGEFVFNERLHEPGTRHVIDRDYEDRGFEQGRAVLLRLAKHPATAKHIATKLARHFIADEPPPALIDRLASRFRDTDGDLNEVSKALVSAPEALEAPRSKLRRPSDWLVGALRAIGTAPDDIRRLLNTQKALGEALWRPAAPNGFSDNNDAWMDGLGERLDVANQLARRSGDLVDPDNVAEMTFGPLLSDDTRRTLAGAESRQQALALLLMSPEFQRR